MGVPDESNNRRVTEDVDLLNSQDLTLRIRSGDRHAFEVMATRYYAQCVRHAYRYVHDLVIAEDIVQDALFSVWVRRATLEIRNSLLSYLFGIVRNRALNYTRHQQVEARYECEIAAHETLNAETFPMDDGGQADDRTFDLYVSFIQDAVAKLPGRQGEAFSLRVEQEMTFAEIAEAMGISLRAAQTNYFRAVQWLRKRLRQDFRA